MKKRKGSQPSVAWTEEARQLTLCGEPVLSYRLCCPQVLGGGPGGARITRYYARLAAAWRERWEKALYWRACLALAWCGEHGLPFRPWSAELSGSVTALEGGLLSLRLDGTEIWGDGRPLRGSWGDVWELPGGTPCPLSRLVGRGRRCRAALAGQAVQVGNSRRAAGDCFLDQGWEAALYRQLRHLSFCLTPEGIELLLPQCAAAPAAEGVVTLSVPRPDTSGSTTACQLKNLFSSELKNAKIPLTISNYLL